MDDRKGLGRPSRNYFASVFLCIIAMTATLGFPATAGAQGVRILVGFAPGGGLDLLARYFAQRLGPQLGVPVVVENMVGANGNIAATAVSNSAPNGRTMLFVSSAHVMNAALDPRIPYDPIKDFAPVTNSSNGLNVIVVNPALGVTTLRQFLDLAKKKPGSLFFSSAGIGTVSHMPAELLKYQAGIDITHVPYKGGAPGLAAVVSGEVQLAVAGLGTAMSFIRAGRLLPLAVTGKERARVLPDVPTADAAGVPGFEFSAWNGFFTSPKTPGEVVHRMRDSIVALLAGAELVKLIEENGYTIVGSTPQEFAATIKTDLETWIRIVKAARIKAEQ